MDSEKVDTWLKENSDRLEIDYQRIHGTESGESNHNFVVEAEEKLILRASRDISRKSRLENEAEKLDFLEKQGIEKVPRKKHFEKNTEIGEILLETYIGDEEVNKENLDRERIRSLARKTAEIHSIPVKKYRNFTGKEVKNERSLKEIFMEDFRKWSERPYREYMKQTDNPDERVKDFFSRQRQLLEKIPDISVRQGLIHGDLGFNLRASGKEVFIIDWEFSKISFPENEILYCFEHEKLDQDQREIFLEEYRRDRNLHPEFEKLRKIYPKFLAFNDMIWAAKRIEEGDDKKELFNDRIEKLRNLYKVK